MKKTITALSLVAVLMLSGCSGGTSLSGSEKSSAIPIRSVQSAESSFDESSMPTVKSSIQSENSIKSDVHVSEITSADSSQMSIANNAKQAFLDKSKDLISNFDSVEEIGINDLDDYYYAWYLCYLNNEDYNDIHVMFYTDDVDVICDKLSKETKQLAEYFNEYGTWYVIYVNDKNNNHIVTISNLYEGFSKTQSLALCWDNEDMQAKYKQLESRDEFKDFTVKVIN